MPPSPSDPRGPPAAPCPASVAADGLRLRVHVTPRAGADRIGPVVVRNRAARLRLAVSARPQEGDANAAVITLLARTLGLPRSAFVIVAGRSGREKTLAIRGEAAALAGRLAQALVLADGGRT